jgi:hypothetical protein
MGLIASALASAVLAILAFPGCSSADDGGGGDEADITAVAEDLPWEVTSDQGESVLPNVFYAEASENEQVMPTAINGHHQVDRLVYPTIGNPNLYTKSDRTDSLMAVLRIEEAAFAHLKPDMSEHIGGTSMTSLKLSEDDANSLSFYLVDRSARASAESEQAVAKADGQHVIRIKPTQIRVHAVPADMPDQFKQRRTLRVVFDATAMAQVPPGLYDLRFEARQGSKIVNLKGSSVYEYQYNSVRVFDRSADEYSAVNVTDTQVSPTLSFKARTLDKLKEFVQRINKTTDPAVRNAAFITFNGDLHNGGSPESVLPGVVASTYNTEAAAILDAIKELNLPIFLTVGNHDGYVATGQTPVLLDPVGVGLKAAVLAAEPKAWPSFSFDQYNQYLSKIAKDPGGLHVDVLNGQFSHRDGKTFSEAWKQIPQANRNMVLYDGQHQWHRTYGPSYAAWSFGKNHYLNLNSFDLRQHRRTGWGMYTVNYGGGMSKPQIAWLTRQITRVESDKANPRDIVLLAHHDPRGGHHGKDFPYLFPQADYKGMPQVIRNFLVGNIVNPKLCALVPSFVLTDAQMVSCIHDGLQEWMLADPEFDCADADKKSDGRCDLNAITANPKKTLYFSNLELIQLLATHPSIRTLLLGHTHYNSLEVLQSGDELAPGSNTTIPNETVAGLNVSNPIRAFSFFNKLLGRDDFDPAALSADQVWSDSDDAVKLYAKASPFFTRGIQGTSRELVVMRLTSNADITHQQFCASPGDCRNMLGFSTFSVERKNDQRAFMLPQINAVTYFLNDGGNFEAVRTVQVARGGKLPVDAPTNPVGSMFQFAK